MLRGRGDEVSKIDNADKPSDMKREVRIKKPVPLLILLPIIVISAGSFFLKDKIPRFASYS